MAGAGADPRAALSEAVGVLVWLGRPVSAAGSSANQEAERFWARHHSSQTTMSAGDGGTRGSPYMVSDLKRASPSGGSGTNGGRRHQRSGTKRADWTSAVGQSRGLVARALVAPSTDLVENMAPTPREPRGRADIRWP